MRLPMFPLGTVLFPGLVLPLHVFEPRYRVLVEDCLATEPPELGVVLIERGSEVGGDDVRTMVGTVARIVEAQQLDEARWSLVTVGVRRIQVVEWLPDDPYPVAEVADWLEDPPTLDLADAFAGVTATLRRALGLAAELGEARAPATIELSDDPVIGTLQACAVAPLGPADQQRLLAAPDTLDRLSLLRTLLDDQVPLLEARLSGPDTLG